MERHKTFQVAEKLLGRIEELLDREDGLDSQALRQLTASVKDLKDVQMIRSDWEIREQEAKIAKLQREARGEEKKGPGTVTVVMDGVLEKYGN